MKTMTAVKSLAVVVGLSMAVVAGSQVLPPPAPCFDVVNIICCAWTIDPTTCSLTGPCYDEQIPIPGVDTGPWEVSWAGARSWVGYLPTGIFPLGTCTYEDFECVNGSCTPTGLDYSTEPCNDHSWTDCDGGPGSGPGGGGGGGGGPAGY